MGVCLICGELDESNVKDAIKNGWVFTRCPECHRGTPLDIIATFLSKTVDERYLEGFCSRHWFKDTGICSYCKMKRGEYNVN